MGAIESYGWLYGGYVKYWAQCIPMAASKLHSTLTELSNYTDEEIQSSTRFSALFDNCAPSAETFAVASIKFSCF